MNFAEGIKTLCKQENISLTKFSALTGIGYSTMRRYTAGTRTPTLNDIEKKILSVPQFEKYRALLLGVDEPIDERFEPGNPEHERFQYLLRKIYEKGLEGEALGVLQALAADQKKDSSDSDA